MRDVLADIDQWRGRGQAVALATVIQTWGSAPRKEGAKMGLTAGGEMAGSVSGGCVEGAVIENGLEVLDGGRPRLLHFGVADETAWDVGLACGGTIEVFVERLDPAAYDLMHRLLDEERPGASATVITGPDELIGRKLIVTSSGERFGSLSSELDAAAMEVTQAALAQGRSRRWRPEGAEGVEVFMDVLLPSPTLVMVGGVHIAIALASLAKTLGYRTIVVDPRRAFGSEARFPHVDQLIQAWPDKALADVPLNSATAVALLTHDPKIDDPALKIVLNSPAFYVGALGSTRTQAKRQQRLLQAGLSQAQLERIRGPIGLDIGAQTPEEIALAIMGEIISVKRKT